MDYSYLDKKEYRGVPILRMIENRNNLPFFITRLKNTCNQEKHRHEYVQIIYACRGKLKHVLNNGVFDICGGDIFVIPPYVPHYYIADTGENYELIEFEFTPEFINEQFSSGSDENSFLDFAYLEPFLMVEYQMSPRLNLTGNVKDQVENLFASILIEYQERQSDFVLMTKSLLLQLLVLVGREYRKTLSEYDPHAEVFKQHREAMTNILKYIDLHIEEDLTVEEVAEKAMLSQSYFRYLFKQLSGRSLIDYINGRRISKAAQLLKSKPEARIIDICYQIGFHHVNYFNKIFLREMGVSPSAYRKMNRLPSAAGQVVEKGQNAAPSEKQIPSAKAEDFEP